MGRGGTARPPEVEWSSGVTAFLGGCYNQDVFKEPKKRHDHLSVLLGVYNKDIYISQKEAEIPTISGFTHFQLPNIILS